MKTYYKLKERNNMRNVFITTVAAMAISTAAFAGDTVTKVTNPYGPLLTGEVALDFTETAGTNDIGGTMSVDLGIDAGGLATVDLDFEVNEAGNGSLADWTVGTTIGGLGVAVGTDNGVMPGAEGEQTLAAPVMTESLAVTAGGASVALGFTDWNTDITDISNIQGAYTIDMDRFAITGAADYNLDSENTVLGAGVSGLDLGLATASGALTYDVDAETFGYEGVAAAYGVTAYLNGDDTDMLQNIGGEYEMDVAGATFTAGANYNLDTEDFTPTAGISFNF
jgi:hypothetical protein